MGGAGRTFEPRARGIEWTRRNRKGWLMKCQKDLGMDQKGA